MKFRRLKKSKLILFDSFRSDVLKDLVLKQKSYSELPCRLDQPDIAIFISIRSFFILLNYFLFKLNAESGYSWKHRLLLAYYSSVVQASGATHVISMYGATNRFFASLSKIHPSVRFEAVITFQIHDRFLDDLKDSEAYYSVMGTFDRDQLISAGIQFEKIRVLGSMHFNAFLQSKFYQENPENKYDIALISQYQHFWEESNCTDIRRVAERIFTEMVKNLSEYLKSSPHLRVAIALRPQPMEKATQMEFDYFKSLLGNGENIVFVSNVPGEFTSYSTIQESSVVLSHYSTIAFEAFALNKPVLFCQYFDYSEKFELPTDLPFALRSVGYETFDNSLSQVLESSRYFDFPTLTSRYNNSSRDGLHELIEQLPR